MSWRCVELLRRVGLRTEEQQAATQNRKKTQQVRPNSRIFIILSVHKYTLHTTIVQKYKIIISLCPFYVKVTPEISFELFTICFEFKGSHQIIIFFFKLFITRNQIYQEWVTHLSCQKVVQQPRSGKVEYEHNQQIPVCNNETLEWKQSVLFLGSHHSFSGSLGMGILTKGTEYYTVILTSGSRIVHSLHVLLKFL